MASTYTAINGAIRLYDSSDIRLASSGGDVVVYDDSTTTYTDKTAEAYSDSGSTTGALLADAADAVYVGHSTKFSRIKVDVVTAGVGTGTLIASYYNGTAWTALTVEDGTDDGTDTFAQDGTISFAIPKDWAKQGDANLDSDKYYVKLQPTTTPTTPPDAELLWPVDGQYFELVFDGGDLSAPEGRARPEERIVLHRGTGDGNTHYTIGSDEPVCEPLDLSFSIRLDNTINRTALREALQCGNPGSANWSGTGVSTKTDSTLTSGDGTTFNTPAFRDSSKKTVCVQIIWETDGVAVGRSFNEVYFPLEQVSLAESEDGVVLSVTGKIYGAIDEIYAFGYRY